MVPRTNRVEIFFGILVRWWCLILILFFFQKSITYTHIVLGARFHSVHRVTFSEYAMKRSSSRHRFISMYRINSPSRSFFLTHFLLFNDVNLHLFLCPPYFHCNGSCSWINFQALLPWDLVLPRLYVWTLEFGVWYCTTFRCIHWVSCAALMSLEKKSWWRQLDSGPVACKRQPVCTVYDVGRPCGRLCMMLLSVAWVGDMPFVYLRERMCVAIFSHFPSRTTHTFGAVAPHWKTPVFCISTPLCPPDLPL